MDNFIEVAGQKVDIIILYKDFYRFKDRANKLINLDLKLRKDGKAGYNFNFFIFWCLYKCIQSKGIWPFKKPFRSLGYMIKRIRQNEYDDIVDFFNEHILGQKTVGSEDKQQGNLKAV